MALSALAKGAASFMGRYLSPKAQASASSFTAALNLQASRASIIGLNERVSIKHLQCASYPATLSGAAPGLQAVAYVWPGPASNASGAGRSSQPPGPMQPAQAHTFSTGLPGDDKDKDKKKQSLLATLSSPYALGALSLVHLAAAIPIAADPFGAADFLFGDAAHPHHYLHTSLLRLVSVDLFAAGAVAYTLRAADTTPDRSSTMDVDHYARLSAALAAFGSAAATLPWLAPDNALTAPGLALASLAFGATAAVGVAGYLDAPEKHLPKAGGPALGSLPGGAGKVKGALRLAGGFNPMVYTALTTAFVVAGAAYVFEPGWTLDATFLQARGPECLFMWRVMGAGLLTVFPVTTYTLKEAAERHTLGATPYKMLNGTLAVAALGHLSVLLPALANGQVGWLNPLLIGVWGLTAVVAAGNVLAGSKD